MSKGVSQLYIVRKAGQPKSIVRSLCQLNLFRRKRLDAEILCDVTKSAVLTCLIKKYSTHMIKTVQNSSPTVSAQENCPLNRKLPQPTGSWSIVYQATLLQRTQIVSSHRVITKIVSSHRHKPALKSSLSNQVPLLWDLIKILSLCFRVLPRKLNHSVFFWSNRKLHQPTKIKNLIPLFGDLMKLYHSILSI